MYTYGPLIAKNARSGRLLGGAPVQVTALDGTPLTTAPAGLVTNHEGYLPAFTVDTDQVTVMARPRGGDPLPLHAHEGIQGAAEVAAAIGEAGMGTAGLAVLAASLPAEAREVLGITIDTSVGTRVFVGGVMVYGKTGWRDVSGLLINGWAQVTANRCRIQRDGNLISFHAYLNPTAATSDIALELPPGAGFYSYDMTMPWTNSSGSEEGTALIQRTGGRVTIPGARAAGQNFFIGGQWATDDPWPSSLPGTAA